MSRLLRVPEVSIRLGLPKKTIRALINRGELPGYKIAGRLLVDEDELEVFQQSRRVIPKVIPPIVIEPRIYRNPRQQTAKELLLGSTQH